MKIQQKLRGLNSLVQLSLSMVAAGKPKPRSLAERLAQLPLEGAPLGQDVTIHWNEHHMPFIEAASDADCAVALGVVHGHLRLGQIEMMRRIAYGRTAEMVGPAGIELDHALRAFHFARSVPAMLEAMSDHTRQWIENFAAGINHVLMKSTELPPECQWLAMEREPWTAADILTVGRLSGADVHWMIWLKLLRFRMGREWPTLWDKLLAQGGVAGVQNYAMGGKGDEAALGEILASAKTGSNSFAAGAAKSGTGSAWMANDPHLPISIPNLWLFAGYKCPTYHVIGYMLPALPFVALGRNHDIAWGGTNLHGANTDLIDVSKEPASAMTVRRETIKVRGSKTVERTVHDSRFGPVISDAPLVATGDRFALKWVGHEVTDEVGAILGFNRAKNWEEFAAAAETFGVSGQNFTYADTQGHVGKLVATIMPRRKFKPRSQMLCTPEQAEDWASLATSKDMPRQYDPEGGFIASANDEPPDCGFPLGFFYSSPDRIRRISKVMGEAPIVTLDLLAELQRDVSLKPALAFRDLILDRYDRAHASASKVDRVEAMLAVLREWDGSYDADSAGALIFETVQVYLLEAFHPPAERAAFSSVWHTRQLMERTLEEATRPRASRIVGRCVERAVPIWEKHKTWGGVHRMRIRHPLGVLPVIGRRFEMLEWGAGGNEDTVMKTGVPVQAGVHGISYGSMARHISNLAEPDENYFALLGGQDGWLGSTTMLDQVPYWREGRYIQVPFKVETVRRTFLHRTVLKSH